MVDRGLREKGDDRKIEMWNHINYFLDDIDIGRDERLKKAREERKDKLNPFAWNSLFACEPQLVWPFLRGYAWQAEHDIR